MSQASKLDKYEVFEAWLRKNGAQFDLVSNDSFDVEAWRFRFVFDLFSMDADCFQLIFNSIELFTPSLYYFGGLRICVDCHIALYIRLRKII